MAIADKILAARTQAALTQEELAGKVGVTPRAVQKWEAGHAEPRASTIRKLATATGRSIGWFLDPTEPEAVA